MTMLADLKAMPEGTEVVGIALLIKPARKAHTDADNLVWQEVVFVDASGDMPGLIALGDHTPPEVGTKEENRMTPVAEWRTNQKVFIVAGELSTRDVRAKDKMTLVVYECRDMNPPLTQGQYERMMLDDKDDYQKARDEQDDIRIRGMCRHGIVCHILGETTDVQSMPRPSKLWKVFIDEWVDYIVTGK